MALKLNIGQKDGKTIQKELSEEHSNALLGKKIGDTVKGDNIGLSGYAFTITGGSDKAGFPMRHDVQGTSRKRILVTKGVGFQGKRKGLRKRRNVAGNTIYEGTVQVNVKVEKEGKASLEGEEQAADGEAASVEGDSEEDSGKEEKSEEKNSEKDDEEASKDDSDESEGSDEDDSADEGSSKGEEDSEKDS